MEALRGSHDFPPGSPPRIPSGSEARFRPFRHGSCVVRLAASLPDLEACLALERGSPAPWRGRLSEPTAVPDCDFLMAADLGRRILGVCRLLPRRPEEVRHSLPGAPRPATGNPRFAGSAALLTALRYSRLGVLETGEMALAGGLGETEAGMVVEALWEGLAEYMSSLGYGFALGRELVTPPDGLALEEVLGILHNDHALHPDLEAGPVSLPRPDWRRLPAGPGESGGGRASGTLPVTGSAVPEAGRAVGGSARDWLPRGLQEGLKRGIHLVGGPVCSASPAGLEFAWVASSELLRRGDGPLSSGSADRSLPGSGLAA